MEDDDLKDYVDNPQETLQVELKSWLDLTGKVTRANIARHICALVNHGGGILVFGFKDDRSVDTSTPDLPSYTTDTFSGITKAYLSPPVQCIAREVVSSTGNRHIVVLVPIHGVTPVCAKAGGPHNSKGVPQGISSGTHYHRATRPESAPVNTEAAWRPILHRCVNEREALLSSLTALIRGTPALSPAPAVGANERLRGWHDTCHSHFLSVLGSGARQE